ncbi:MAG TPA: aminotransferase class V-fold PLP-dependent enzyme [Candidatus Eremiobacteraceae bacterium]|nr:aminotransferase class V-fold PLP-dependent enzyme [Candidatus Eremiobacteraceae bacterium]
MVHTAMVTATTPLARSLFPISAKWTYCNHASVGPLTTRARDAMVAAMDAQMTMGCNGILEVEAQKEAVRRQTAAAIGAGADEIAFMHSTSDGALLASNGIDWRPGDEIVLTDNEFGANAYPWLNLRDRGVGVRLLHAPAERLTVDALERVVTKRTRLVAASYVSFGDGYRHDVAAIGAWARERGVLFALDAIQGFGHLPLDVGAWKVDFCYFGVAKWLLSPQALSVVYVRRDLIETLRPALCSWRSVRDPMRFLDYGQALADGAVRFEGATINYPALLAFRESLDVLTAAGLDVIEAHVLALTARLIDAATRAGIAVLSSTAPGTRSGIVLLKPRSTSVEELQARADKAAVQVTARDTGVRVSPHGYNTLAEMDRVIEAFA